MIERIKPTSDIGGATIKNSIKSSGRISASTRKKQRKKKTSSIDTKIIEEFPKTDEVAVNSVAFVFASKESSWTA